MSAALPEPDTPSPEAICQKTRAFVLKWIASRQGSAAELVRALEEEAGWRARLCLAAVLDELRAARGGPEFDRKYLLYTLSAGAVTEALAGGGGPPTEHQSTLDDLFRRSRRFRHTKKFVEAIQFMARFRDYSPFNVMLVQAQNPLVTHFATESDWRKKFGRTVKPEARGMLILAPRTPVLLVYDVAETEGPPLPDKLEHLAQTSGPFNPALLDRTVKNCERNGIHVERRPMDRLRGGFSTARVYNQNWKMRVGLRDTLDDAAAYAVLCHELAHIYLGHLGADKAAGWPYRVNLPQTVAEIEAESVAHIVCRRAGLKTRSDEYLSMFVEDGDDIDAISLDLISRVAGKLEEMGQRLLPPR